MKPEDETLKSNLKHMPAYGFCYDYHLLLLQYILKIEKQKKNDENKKTKTDQMCVSRTTENMKPLERGKRKKNIHMSIVREELVFQAVSNAMVDKKGTVG